jgi:proteasome lid subunit RPN8/RPN11
MSDRFELATCLTAEILAHARECYPQEACGIVAGTGNRGTLLFRGLNVSSTPRVAFELDPVTLARQAEFESTGLAMTAVYHSHPTGPDIPSRPDVEGAREGYPESVCIVCNLADARKPVLRAFRVEDGRAREISLVQAPEGEDLTECVLPTKLIV